VNSSRHNNNPLSQAAPLSKPKSACGHDDSSRHISEWAVQAHICNSPVLLFGCTEDIYCEAVEHHAFHAEEYENEPFVRQLCSKCQIPICYSCWSKLYNFSDRGSVPMSLVNDHYYSYIDKFLVEQNVSWLECAASSICWSTMLVYYLEDPYGHLMGETMGKPEGRTKVRGNLFSFNMPWQDIERCCANACRHATSPHRENLREIQSNMALPHDEETLALLVNVHIRGGSKDLATHLSGLTLRVAVVQALIEIMRRSGYAGYENRGINSPDKVAQRLKERYTDVYGQAAFIPEAVMTAISVERPGKISIVQDKIATPSDNAASVTEWNKTVRPHTILAERSVRSQGNIHENYRRAFAQFGDFEISTGSEFVDQFKAWYLGMAHPFTMPLAVGGYDVPHEPRWRRPEDDDIPFPRSRCSNWMPKAMAKHSEVGPACRVKLFDITRSLPQRIEGQFRRHWGFAPAVWNLYFREQLNLGISLSVKQVAPKDTPADSRAEDAAMAAVGLLQKLDHGFYLDRGKRRKINGDFSTCQFPDGHTRKMCCVLIKLYAANAADLSRGSNNKNK
jgi:hypothetical protein